MKKPMEIVAQGITTFLITLVIAIVVTLLWNLFIEKTGAVPDVKTSFLLAIIIGIVLPLSRSRYN